MILPLRRYASYQRGGRPWGPLQHFQVHTYASRAREIPAEVEELAAMCAILERQAEGLTTMTTTERRMRMKRASTKGSDMRSLARKSRAASQPTENPIRDKMAPEAFYQSLDPGIRFPVRVLHANGMDTCQSCQGGEGHAYVEPTIDMISTGTDSDGFQALAALQSFGIEVNEIAIVWPVANGLPYERLWRIILKRAYPERADETPMFIWGYRAQRHPTGEEGTVVYRGFGPDTDMWQVDYGDLLSRLCLQVGDKGMAVVVPQRRTP